MPGVLKVYLVLLDETTVMYTGFDYLTAPITDLLLGVCPSLAAPC